MPNIEYAKPFHRGVTSIMGVGDVEIAPSSLEDNLRHAQWLSVGAWAAFAVLGMKGAKQAALGASVATFALSYWTHLQERKAAEQAIQATQAPTAQPAVQGWWYR